MSQNEQIAEYLRDGNPITPMEALRLFGCSRLSARILELKGAGMDIDSTMIEVEGEHGTARVARYVLKREAAC